MNLDFTNDQATTGTYEPLPKGEYNVSCIEAEVKSTKDNTGSYISTVFRINEGSHEGRKLFQNFTLTNKNDKAVQIGRGQLKSFMAAAKAKSFNLSSITDLCGMQAIAKVDIEKSDQYGDRNKITSFKENSTAAVSSVKSTTAKANPFV